MSLDAALNKVVSMVPECLAGGYVDLTSGMLLSIKTVDAHKYNLMRKLDIHNRAGLVKYAIRKKLVHVPVLGGESRGKSHEGRRP